MRFHPTRLALAAILIAGVASSPRAADFSDPTWPCIQRKVLHLSPGQMWAGPVIDDSIGDWRADAEVAELVPALALRRTPMEEAEAMIAGFAETLGERRNERLTLLFAGAFGHIDRERTEIISGIARYAARQSGLEERIDTLRDEISTLEAVAEPSFDQQDRLEELQDQLAWDTRIFEERRQSLTYVCETPVLLEQRAFALARAVMAHLE